MENSLNPIDWLQHLYDYRPESILVQEDFDDAKRMFREQIIQSGNSCAMQGHLHWHRVNNMNTIELVEHLNKKDELTFGEEYYNKVYGSDNTNANEIVKVCSRWLADECHKGCCGHPEIREASITSCDTPQISTEHNQSKIDDSEPNPELIESMSYRYRHDFAFLDSKHQEAIRTTMKQLWEEVVGKGFYRGKSEKPILPTPSKIDKDEQKKMIVEIMDADAKDGLYEASDNPHSTITDQIDAIIFELPLKEKIKLYELIEELYEELDKSQTEISDEEIEKEARKLANIEHNRPLDLEERYYKDYQKYDGIVIGMKWYREQLKLR